MCGILGCVNHPDAPAYRSKMLQLSRSIRHRGPDWSGCLVATEEGASPKGSILCHERLAIVGVDTGAQPLVSNDGKVILAVNGEIYNHRTLRKSLKNKSPQFKTHSDCEVILHLYEEYGRTADFVTKLDGMFSFLLVDTSVSPHRVISARDPIGVTTLYQGWSYKYPGAVYFSSELKAIHEECDRVRSFPPGHYWDSARPEGEETVRYYNPKWINDDDNGASVPTTSADLTAIRLALEKAVRKRLMSEVPYGVLLSGGLDSSLIASIAARETEVLAEKQHRAYEARMAAKSQAQSRADIPPVGNSAANRTDVDPTKALAPAGADGRMAVGLDEDAEAEADSLAAWPRLHSFSIGLPGSPDLLAARQAAAYLGTVHHEYTFTVQEGLDAIPDVIYHLETYDVTTVRASTPMYLLSRKIKAMGVKMVLSGEGSDEIFGGYLYFHAAPDAKSFHQECVRRVKNLHTADCLRANKSTMAWGLEARVPFLDKEFLDVALLTRADDKQFSKGSLQEHDVDGKPRMEKYILRKAFDVDAMEPVVNPKTGEKCKPKAYLPDSILWRQKEQFSDGVGYSWIDGMKEYSEKAISDQKFAERAKRYPADTPDTKEAYWIREVFESYFPSESAARTSVRWVPRGDWGCSSDPSGRSVAIHDAAYRGEA
ncbi:putative asparagine synthase [Tilletiaria anomala UBC 951]|uniref:asparagine synthase (glutamine-hydrolyzing) n=1 Tax=Tilletiaria anomala (strain ATCC 24038 / CBS 436.72 / UBC 951) TaxID=1037660 RepID=A0A066VD30_TILAU|nr:putative asparagine synthase [Tilletiaria anomala UBC 951]KDN39331.1 putative asparagine synthase [Tilletiaria anomala UBC 951]